MHRLLLTGLTTVAAGLTACGSTPAVVGTWGTGLDDCTPDRAITFTSAGKVTRVGREIGTWVAQGDDIAVDMNGDTRRGRVTGEKLSLGSQRFDRCPG